MHPHPEQRVGRAAGLDLQHARERERPEHADQRQQAGRELRRRACAARPGRRAGRRPATRLGRAPRRIARAERVRGAHASAIAASISSVRAARVELDVAGQREEHRLERAHDQLEPAYRDVRPAEIEHEGVDAALHGQPELAGRGPGGVDARVPFGDLERAGVVAGGQPVGRARSLLAQLLGAPVPHHLAQAQHRERVAHVLQIADQVAREEHRGALGGEPAHQPGHVAGARRIKAAGRLVEQQQPRRAQQRGGDPQALAHAGRVAADAILAAPGQARPARARSSTALAADAAVELGQQLEVHAPGQVGIERRLLDEPPHAVEVDRVGASRADGRTARPRPRRARPARTAAAAAWSCRRRWGRAGRAPRPPARRGRPRPPRIVVSKRLTRPLARTAATRRHYRTGGIFTGLVGYLPDRGLARPRSEVRSLPAEAQGLGDPDGRHPEVRQRPGGQPGRADGLLRVLLDLPAAPGVHHDPRVRAPGPPASSSVGPEARCSATSRSSASRSAPTP